MRLKAKVRLKAEGDLKNPQSWDRSPELEPSSLHLLYIHICFRNIHATVKLFSWSKTDFSKNKIFLQRCGNLKWVYWVLKHKGSAMRNIFYSFSTLHEGKRRKLTFVHICIIHDTRIFYRPFETLVLVHTSHHIIYTQTLCSRWKFKMEGREVTLFQVCGNQMVAKQDILAGKKWTLRDMGGIVLMGKPLELLSPTFCFKLFPSFKHASSHLVTCC